MIINTTYFKASESVLVEAFYGETVLLNTKAGQYYGLSEVSTFAFEKLRRGATFDAVVTSVLDEFEVTTDKASQDLQEFVVNLLNLGLLEKQR